MTFYSTSVTHPTFALSLPQPVQVKKKMEEVEFCRNLRGVNDGKDFPKEFLSNIYHSICSGE